MPSTQVAEFDLHNVNNPVPRNSNIGVRGTARLAPYHLPQAVSAPSPARLRNKELLLRANVGEQWCHELSQDRRFACEQNAVIVSSVLVDMPDAVRSQLVELLETCKR